MRGGCEGGARGECARGYVRAGGCVRGGVCVRWGASRVCVCVGVCVCVCYYMDAFQNLNRCHKLTQVLSLANICG